MKMQDDNKKYNQRHLFTDELRELMEREICKLQNNSLVGNKNACKKHKESKLPPYTPPSKEQIEKDLNDVLDRLGGNYLDNLFKWEPTVTTEDLKKETINSQEHYKGKDSLYKFAEECGKKEKEGKVDYSELNWNFIDGMCKRFADNKHKYSAGNMKKPIDKQELLQASIRHLRKMVQPVEGDNETFEQHLYAVGCNMSMLQDQIEI